MKAKRKYTEEQKRKALEKMARSFARWNKHPRVQDTLNREMRFITAAWAVIKKFDLVPVYEGTV